VKKITIFLLFATLAHTAFCRNQRKDAKRNTPTQFAFDITGSSGSLAHKMNTADGKIGTFLQPAIYNPGTLKFSNGSSKGFDFQTSWFFGQKRKFGMGVEFWYCQQKGDMSLEGFHVEYKATDKYGWAYRQLLTSNILTESQNISQINLPIVAKYRLILNRKLTVNVDAGIVINVREEIKYKSHAAFDFESIYKFQSSGPPVYDDAVVPDNTDMFTTKSYLQSLGYSSSAIQSYFENSSAAGSTVGLNVIPNTSQNSESGIVSYSAGSIGFLLRPSVAYNLSPEWSVVLAGYAMSMSIKNKPKDDYRIMDIDGNYSSPLKAVKSLEVTSYGLNLGLRYSFVHKVNRRLHR
jgi:hypothetical protein